MANVDIVIDANPITIEYVPIQPYSLDIKFGQVDSVNGKTGTVSVNEVPNGGTAGQLLAKNSNTNNDTKWIDAPSGGTTIYDISSIRYSGKKYSFPYTGGNATAAGFGGSTLVVCPTPIGESHAITAITAYVSTSAAASIRLGIYSESNGYPSDLLIDSGNISCATTGAKTFVFPTPIVLTGKLFFPAIMVESGSIGLDYAQGVLPLLQPNGASYVACQLRYQPYGGTHGAMPATFLAGLTPVTGWGIILELTKQ